MSRSTLTTALALYRTKTLCLADAAAYTGISEEKMASALSSQGIAVREEDQEPVASRAAD